MAHDNTKHGFTTFIFILVGHVISGFGSGLTGFALGVWVYQQTGSATQYALISMFSVLPGILASPFAGALVDRWDRRWALIISDSLAALVTLGFMGLLLAGRLEIWHIYLGTMIQSLAGSLFRPALFASITLLVDKRDYGRTNGMIQLGVGSAQIAAPALAGVLVAAIQIWRVLIIDFVTFLVAIAVLLVVRIPRPLARVESRPGAEGKPVHSGLLQEATFGWTYITARRGLLGLLIFFAITNFALGIVEVLLTPLVLGFSGTVVLGRVLTAAGVGMLLGGIVMSVWRGPKRHVFSILGFTLLQGMLLLLGGVKPNASLVAVAAVVFLFCSQVVVASSQAIWQSKVAPDVQGRVFAIRATVALSSAPLAYMVAGPLADYIFEPLLAVGGPLSGTVGLVIGIGRGRGIGLLFIVMGMILALAVIAGYLYSPLRRVELDLPDATLEHELPTTTADNLLQPVA